MKGTLATSGSLAEQLKKARHGGDAVNHAFVHADVEDVRAVLHLLPRHAYRFFILALLDQLGELRRAGDVGPLADHDVDAGCWVKGCDPERRSGFVCVAEIDYLGRAQLWRRSGRAALRCVVQPAAEAALRALWRWPRCVRACCRSTRRQY